MLEDAPTTTSDVGTNGNSSGVANTDATWIFVIVVPRCCLLASAILDSHDVLENHAEECNFFLTFHCLIGTPFLGVHIDIDALLVFFSSKCLFGFTITLRLITSYSSALSLMDKIKIISKLRGQNFKMTSEFWRFCRLVFFFNKKLYF